MRRLYLCVSIKYSHSAAYSNSERQSEKQKDWISNEMSPGRWKEARSYLRFSRPALGIRDGLEIFPISPCQEFVSVFDKSGRYLEDESFSIMNISAFDPHTTAKKSRGCLECHQDPKVIGLGEGILHQKGGKRVFRPTYDSSSSPPRTGPSTGTVSFKKPSVILNRTD